MFSIMNSVKAFLLVCILIGLLNARTNGKPTYIFHSCPKTATFAPNSAYQTNLNHLLSSLSSNANQTDGFYNTPVGQNNPSTAIYGLFLCRGDVTIATCQDCVSTATKGAPQNCSSGKEYVVWYEECLLRYSDQSFFSTAQENPLNYYFSTDQDTDNVSEKSHFMKLLGDTLRAVAERAAKGSDRKKFATKEANFTTFQTLYTLGQCTPDLSSDDCNKCLQVTIGFLPNCGECDGKQGLEVITPSCYIRYALYPFYQKQDVEVPSPSASTPELTPKQKAPSSPAFTPELTPSGKSKISARTIIAIVGPTVIFLLLLASLGCCYLKRRARNKYISVPEQNVEISSVESLQFDLDTIKSATNNFCPDNKLGEGGFGEVYKGTLPTGQEIAVKRLSKTSSQGVEQFKNEVVTMAQLRHRNLVRLLGFCLDEQEKILIYEFVHNKSLDHFLFESGNRGKLDWSKCYKIIQGIARGILYLHEDSQLRIIHRDLKASNVLLDKDLNPKISDFGIARIFGVDQTQENTNKVVGTFGYISPEYAMHGQISVKSDVYSFGVLILEIISGKKNTSFHVSSYAEDLLSYAWKLWREGTPLELLDISLRDSYSRIEVLRCIHICLLCVQENPVQRPTMQSIIVMLSSHSITLSEPQKPAFFIGHTITDSNMPSIDEHGSDQSISKSVQRSVDEDPVSDIYPR